MSDESIIFDAQRVADINSKRLDKHTLLLPAVKGIKFPHTQFNRVRHDNNPTLLLTNLAKVAQPWERDIISYLLAMRNNHDDYETEIFLRSYDSIYGFFFIHHVILWNNIDFLRYTIDLYLKFPTLHGFVEEFFTNMNCELLLFATHTQRYDAICYLVRRYNFYVPFESPYNNTTYRYNSYNSNILRNNTLNLAIVIGNIEVVDFIIRCDPKQLQLCDDYQNPPIFIAAMWNKQHIIDYLIKYHNVLFTTTNKNGDYLDHFVYLYGDNELNYYVEELFTNYYNNYYNTNQYSSLHGTNQSSIHNSSQLKPVGQLGSVVEAILSKQYGIAGSPSSLPLQLTRNDNDNTYIQSNHHNLTISTSTKKIMEKESNGFVIGIATIPEVSDEEERGLI